MKKIITFDQFVSLLESAIGVQFDGNALVYPYIDNELDADGNWINNYVMIAYWSDGDEFEYTFYPADIQEIAIENGVIVVIMKEPTSDDPSFIFRLLDTMPIPDDI